MGSRGLGQVHLVSGLTWSRSGAFRLASFDQDTLLEKGVLDLLAHRLEHFDVNQVGSGARQDRSKEKQESGVLTSGVACARVPLYCRFNSIEP